MAFVSSRRQRGSLIDLRGQAAPLTLARQQIAGTGHPPDSDDALRAQDLAAARDDVITVGQLRAQRVGVGQRFDDDDVGEQALNRRLQGRFARHAFTGKS